MQNIDPNKAQTWHVRSRVYWDMDDRDIQYAYQSLTRQAGNEIYELLRQMKSPCVVDIDEHLPDINKFRDLPVGSFSLEPTVEIGIDIRLTPVLYRNVTMAKYAPIEYTLPETKTIREKLQTTMQCL